MMLSSTVDLVSKREQVIERMKKGKFRAMKGSQVLLAKLNTQRGHYMNDQCEEEEETGESMTSREPDLRDIVNKQQVMFRILNEENLFLIEKNQEYEQELHEKEAELQSARKELQRMKTKTNIETKRIVDQAALNVHSHLKGIESRLDAIRTRLDDMHRKFNK